MQRSLLPRSVLSATLLPAALLATDPREGGRRDLPRERAEWNAAFRRDAEGTVDGRRRLEALEHACRLPVDPSMAPVESRTANGPSLPALATFPGTSWQALGPQPIRSGSQWGDASGRVTAIAIHPTNPSVVLAGAATGGIWKTTDGGTTWRAVSDTAPALAMSAIVFSPSNPNVVYAATGEADSADLEFRPSTSLGTYLGAGVLRSVDQGSTWTRIDTNLPANSVVSRVLVHPTNPQLVLAGLYITQDLAANGSKAGGLWRSTDGGVTFAKTFSHAVSDLAQDPNQADAVYAAFGVSRGCTTCADPSGVYKSTDFGATFHSSLVPGGSITFQSPTGNIKIGLTRTNPVTLYASVLDTNDEHAGGGVYRSTDAGATWSARGSHPDMCGSQCSYDHFILPSPNDPETVYFGAIDLFKSTNGGTSWSHLTDVYRGRALTHPDQHVAAIHPSAPSTIFVGNDGGLFRSTDGGLSYASLNGSVTLAQFNGISLSPTDPNVAMGGTQDNGNLRFTGGLSWSDVTGGDGGFNLVKSSDANVRLAANYFAYMNYSSDGGTNFDDVTAYGVLMSINGNPKETMAFYPPAVAAPAAPGTVFFATRRIWVNPQFGKDPNAWTPRSTGNVMNPASSIVSLDVAGDGTGVIWAGTYSGMVLYSTDGGATFVNRATSALPAAMVSKIKIVSGDGRSAYVTFGGFSGLPSRHVFRTTDGGATFANLSGDLPDVPVATLAVDPGDPTDLFVGTDVGVFRSRNGGASWTSYNQGLPNVPVMDLVFHPSNGDLWAATYGRGAFRIPASGGGGVLSPTAVFSFSPPLPAPGQSVAFTDLSSGPPDTWGWDFGDGFTSSAKNPRHVYQQAGSYTVRLGAGNIAGSSTATQTLVVASGSVSPVTLQIPVVLDVFGVPPTHYTSDLVAVNRSGASTRVTVQYLPQPGTPGAGGPKIGLALDQGHELRVADVLAFLRTNGYDLPASGDAQVGTLRLTFEDVSDPALVFAGSRTSTPNPNAAVGGSFGLFSAAPAVGAALTTSGTIFALREDGSFRSNLAIVDVPGGSGPATLSLQVWNGDTGAAAGAPVSYTLQPGEWHQFGTVMAGKATNGYVKITKTGGGSNRFIAYGVVNDGPSSGGGTSDGSFVGTDAAEGLVPIVLSVTSSGVLYTSELYLANTGTGTVTATLTYTPAALLGGTGGPYSGTVSIGAGRQVRIPDTIAYLRDTLHMPIPSGLNVGGTLQVSGAVAYVRTSNPNPDSSVGGTFGLAYPAVASAARAKTEAWIYGLVQDGATRSNLAIADARVGVSGAVTYLIDVYDADSGSSTPASSFSATLAGGQWYQFSSVLSGTGVTHGYARVRPQSGTSDFVAYAVLNDGGAPGQRTSDGSYVPASGIK